MRAAVFVNEKRINGEILNGVKAKLISSGIEPVFCDFFQAGSEDEFELILTFGGDGTVLRAAVFAVEKGLPMLTFKAGRVGFLTAFELNQLEEAISLLKSGKLVSDVRNLIKIDTDKETFYALNDCVIERDGPSRTIALEIAIEGFSSYHVVGDGIVVSTGSGSTAYAMAAGGTISDPYVTAYQIVPISPHNPYVGPLLVSGHRKMTITVAVDRGTPLSVYSDGIIIKTMKEGDTLKLAMSDKAVTLLRPGELDFVSILKTKLAFGGRLKNGI